MILVDFSIKTIGFTLFKCKDNFDTVQNRSPYRHATVTCHIVQVEFLKYYAIQNHTKCEILHKSFLIAKDWCGQSAVYRFLTYILAPFLAVFYDKQAHLECILIHQLNRFT